MNEHGYRSNSFKDKSEYNILTLGCSWTMGVGVRNEAIWPTLVKEKIQTSLVFKSTLINNINNFEEYHTNYWREFKPRLEYNEITWHPEKLLNSANLKEVTYNNIDKISKLTLLLNKTGFSINGCF